MPEPFDNPFSATRAADFTDEQIFQYWVDLGDDGGFLELVRPKSDLPMLILGGKGSGKTHVMRYLSFQLQRLRHTGGLVSGVRDEGYVGIYMRCSGLNSARFRSKGQSPEVWASVFAYYMEMWLAEIVSEVFSELLSSSDAPPGTEHKAVSRIRALLDDDSVPQWTTFGDLIAWFKGVRRSLDIAINNSVIDGTLDVRISATAGKLIYGIPEVLTATVPRLERCMVVYLIDECENLTADQQVFVNSLIREKRPPCSFKVGFRLYGAKTKATYCADEENKEGSEFETLRLDSRLRDNEEKYKQFAKRLVAKRLAPRGEGPIEDLVSTFATPNTDGLAEDETAFVLQKYSGRERPHFFALKQLLNQGLSADVTPGIATADDVDAIVERLRCPEYPLLEKLNCFSFYQRWSVRDDLATASESIRQQCAEYKTTRPTAGPYHDKLLHFKYDLLAQLRRECDQKQVYAGWTTLVDLSWGNPRHLLILLKEIVSWAAFKGEVLFGSEPISIAAQTAGVRKAAEWFFKDARMTGKDGKHLHEAISRLGTLFRAIRYSHKPSECSLCTFSFDPASVTDETSRLLDLAEKWSLLVAVEGGQRDRNSERVDVKLQLNRMLAPLWDISFSRRGTLPLPGPELSAIFDPAHTSEFEDMLKVREGRMMAPFFGARPVKKDTSADGQALLPGMDNG